MNVDKIVEDIISLTDSLENAEDSDEAWNKLQRVFSYLSAKDTMLKYRMEHDD